MARLGALLVLLALFSQDLSGAQALLLPSYYESHMVLQHSQPALFWGIAVSGQSITVTVGAATFNATAAIATGRWEVTIPATPASLVPINITIKTSGGAVRTLQDVLFGQVYICSGQSNMELPVYATLNATSNVAAAGTHGAGLRIMMVALLDVYDNVSTPQTNLTAAIPWSRPSAANVPGMSALCYYFGVEMVTKHPEMPVGLIASSWGGTAVEVWMSPAALASCGEPVGGTTPDLGPRPADPGLAYLRSSTVGGLNVDFGGGVPQVKSTLWNTMMAPMIPLKVEGFLWYQGESNAGRPESYGLCFPAMISQWRDAWGQGATPFIFVQLAPWPDHDVEVISGTRYAQLKALKLPVVGMVVTADIGDPAGCHHPIHPPWKQEVARRAALIAENFVYKNTSIPLQGPQPVSVTWDAWNVTWGSYHHDSGISVVCNNNPNGWKCGGIRVKYDQPITLRSQYGAQYGMGGGTGFELWNDIMGKAEQGTTSSGSRQLVGALCMDCNACPCKQPMEVTGVLADGVTLQLNTTFVSGNPGTLKYAFHDYPTMIVFDAVHGRPAAPFNITITLA